MPAPTRSDAWNLLCEWTAGDALRKHALAVEAAVGWYGEQRFGIREPELETWRAAGLLHDFDYERYPETHPVRGAEELRRPRPLTRRIVRRPGDPGARSASPVRPDPPLRRHAH